MMVIKSCVTSGSKTDPCAQHRVPRWGHNGCVPELPAAAERVFPADLLRLMLACFATGDLRRVPEIVAPLYFDHQSEELPPPHGPELFCRVVQEARKSLPRLVIEVVTVRSVGLGMAESHTHWHWTDESGQRRVRATVDRIRVERGEVVEHWGREEPV